jgi:hypothetical protein
MLDRQKDALASSPLSLQPEGTSALEEGGQNSCGGVTTCGLTSILYFREGTFWAGPHLGLRKTSLLLDKPMHDAKVSALQMLISFGRVGCQSGSKGEQAP